MAIDEQKVEEAVGKVFGDLGVAITGPLIALGDRLGLWAAMAGAGPVTPKAPSAVFSASAVTIRSRSGTAPLLTTVARSWTRPPGVAL